MFLYWIFYIIIYTYYSLHIFLAKDSHPIGLPGEYQVTLSNVIPDVISKGGLNR